jgi:hypothetical protein
MAAIQPIPSVAGFPPDCLAFVAIEAARDADVTTFFLGTLGFQASPGKPVRLPARFLLHLGAALRLLRWEVHGFYYHRAAGLPDAAEAIREALLSAQDPAADPKEFCVAVLRLTVERFAWAGCAVMAADVAVDELADEQALEALAEYLWANRHATGVADGSQPGV